MKVFANNTRRRLPLSIAIQSAFVLAAAFTGHANAAATQLAYIPLSQPCRLMDTRTTSGGPGPLTAGSPYLLGSSDAAIESAAQNGSATGCGVPANAAAISVNMNMLNTTASGNIATWNADAGNTAPNIGTGVYNPSVLAPSSGQVLYNTGYTTVGVGSSSGANPGQFYLQVANGSIDMTINVVGYWVPVSAGSGLTTIVGNSGTPIGVPSNSSGGIKDATVSCPASAPKAVSGSFSLNDTHLSVLISQVTTVTTTNDSWQFRFYNTDGSAHQATFSVLCTP